MSNTEQHRMTFRVIGVREAHSIYYLFTKHYYYTIHSCNQLSAPTLDRQKISSLFDALLHTLGREKKSLKMYANFNCFSHLNHWVYCKNSFKRPPLKLKVLPNCIKKIENRSAEKARFATAHFLGGSLSRPNR